MKKLSQGIYSNREGNCKREKPVVKKTREMLLSKLVDQFKSSKEIIS